MANEVLRLYNADEAHDIAEELVDVYAEVYSVPPYDGDPFFSRDTAAKRLDGALEMDGFQVLTARQNDELTGYVYGVSLTPDKPWWTRISDELDVDLKLHAEAGDIFWLRELLVREPWRNAGLGRRLHDAIIEQRMTDFKETWTTLTCIVDNEPAYSAYLRWGYEIVGQIRHAPESPLYDAMILPPGEH